MKQEILRVLRSTYAAGMVLLSASVAAVAHDEGGSPDPALAESVAPGIMGIGLLIAAVLATALWFHFRRIAMLRAIREQTGSATGSDSASTQAQDGR